MLLNFSGIDKSAFYRKKEEEKKKSCAEDFFQWKQNTLLLSSCADKEMKSSYSNKESLQALVYISTLTEYIFCFHLADIINLIFKSQKGTQFHIMFKKWKCINFPFLAHNLVTSVLKPSKYKSSQSLGHLEKLYPCSQYFQLHIIIRITLECRRSDFPSLFAMCYKCVKGSLWL